MRSNRQLLVIAGITLTAALGAGCSSDSSSKPSEKILTGRVKTGMKVAVETDAKTKVQPGSVACTVKLDDKAKLATYTCQAKSDAGKTIALTGSSTYAQVKDKKKKALSGTFAIVVDSAAPVNVTCVGSGC